MSRVCQVQNAPTEVAHGASVALPWQSPYTAASVLHHGRRDRQAETVAVVSNTDQSLSRGATGMVAAHACPPRRHWSLRRNVRLHVTGASAAMSWHRWQHEYNAPADRLVVLAVNSCKNGALNPNAVFQQPISYPST
jgi:hypothetical protein